MLYNQQFDYHRQSIANDKIDDFNILHEKLLDTYYTRSYDTEVNKLLEPHIIGGKWSSYIDEFTDHFYDLLPESMPNILRLEQYYKSLVDSLNDREKLIGLLKSFDFSDQFELIQTRGL